MEIPQGDTYHFLFTTRDFDTGAPQTLTSGTFSVYEEGSATQILATQSLTADFDTTTGLNHVSIVCSSGNGFDVGSYYSVVLDAGTVDGVAVTGEVIGHFRIMPPEDAGAGIKDVNITHVSDVAEDIATETKQNTAQTDLDTITGADGVTLAAASVDAIWDEVLDAGSHNVANSSGKRIRDIQETGAVYGGFIWIDTINGTAGTDAYVNGTSDNPVDTIADANTLAAAVGIDRFQVSPGSSITFAAGQTNEAFYGIGWTLALGNQDISGSAFFGADVSGIGTNTTGSQYFVNCDMGASTLPTDTHCINCGLSGTQTLGEPGNFFYDNCHSSVAGTGSVTLDFNTPATETNVSIRHHSGGFTVENMGAGAGTCNASFEGNGQIVWAATCAATSNASIRGNWRITDNASGAVTETLDDNQTVVDAVKVKTDQLTFTKANEIDANTKSINGATVTGDGNATPWDGA